MDITVKINDSRAESAMTLWLLGQPGELIPLKTPDINVLKSFPLHETVKLLYHGKKLSVYVDTVVSNIETREIWIMSYLQKVE